MIELWQKGDGDHFVRVEYRNDEEMEPQEPQRQTLPNCAQDCPLNDFLRLTEKAVPKNFEKECRLSPGN